MSTAREMEEQAQIKHQEVLNTIETISNSDSASSACKDICLIRAIITDTQISRIYSGSYANSNSISMLPAEPKIFYGRESELADILNHFRESTPRIAILGAGGMGKTSLAQTVLHHEEIMMKYQGNRLFVVCDTAASKVELAGLIGAHLGMKPGKDLTRALLYHLSEGSPTLLILDNLETVWEPVESCKEVEEFLPLLTDIASLALMVFQDYNVRSRKTLQSAMDTAIPAPSGALGTRGYTQVDVEGCTAILSRWQREHTSVISEGYDQRSNLESSILLSLENGLSDVELKQSNFAIQDILDCKRALLRTSLAYTDGNKRLKVLVPIREYMAKFLPPMDKMIKPLFKHFWELLQAYEINAGKESAALYVKRLTSNYTNIPNIIQNGLHPGHPNLADSISCTSYFIRFSTAIGNEVIPLIDKVISLLPHSEDHQAKASFTVRLFGNHKTHPIPHPEALIAQTLEWLKTLDDPDLEGLCTGGTEWSLVDRRFNENLVPRLLKSVDYRGGPIAVGGYYFILELYEKTASIRTKWDGAPHDAHGTLGRRDDFGGLRYGEIYREGGKWMGMGTRASGGNSKSDGEYTDKTTSGLRRREGRGGQSAGVEEERARFGYGGGGGTKPTRRWRPTRSCKRLVHSDSNTIPVRQFRTGGRLFVCESGDEQGDSEGREKDKEGIKSRKRVRSALHPDVRMYVCEGDMRMGRVRVFSAAQGRIEAARVPVNQVRIGVRWAL
ncbi:hypothetical protein B0H16DRAFT_1688847 [Mycena metata]|uniref:Novel STAND NTPase 1 domain-containing protein n=1 Tax=Mycena metata TaxID=1033252 RepID=A0AAD7J903_9AGAR|nr:hypothetical protein B0H16DRAFT_1688847 [Mycena metata]